MKALRGIQIVEYLRRKRHCSVNELMERFGVSSATLHRDISALASRGLVKKMHGGVATAEEEVAPSPQFSSHFAERIGKNAEVKRAIAAQAAERVQSGDIVFLDSSTSSLYLARELQRSSLSVLTIITNSVLIIQEFHLFPSHFVLIALGGNFNCQLNSFLGRATVTAMGSLRINKAFISAFGATPAGITTYHEEHALFLQKVLQLAERNYLLVDSSKLGRSGLFPIVGLDELDEILSEKKLPEGFSR